MSNEHAVNCETVNNLDIKPCKPKVYPAYDTMQLNYK